MTEKQQNNLLYVALALVLGAIVIVYFKLIKPTLDGAQGLVNTITGPFTKTADEKKKEKSIIEAASNSSPSISNSYKTIQGQRTTKTENEWKAIADTIDNEINGIVINESDIVYQICRCKNNADYYCLRDQYGARWLEPLWIKEKLYNLEGILRQRLNQTSFDTINDNFRRKGMTIKL